MFIGFVVRYWSTSLPASHTVTYLEYGDSKNDKSRFATLDATTGGTKPVRSDVVFDDFVKSGFSTAVDVAVPLESWPVCTSSPCSSSSSSCIELNIALISAPSSVCFCNSCSAICCDIIWFTADVVTSNIPPIALLFDGFTLSGKSGKSSFSSWGVILWISSFGQSFNFLVVKINCVRCRVLKFSFDSVIVLPNKLSSIILFSYPINLNLPTRCNPPYK